jgi:hypothetical protein
VLRHWRHPWLRWSTRESWNISILNRSSWKASPPHNLLKEQPAVHAKSCPIGPQSHCSAALGISYLWAPPGPCSTKLPPHRLTQLPPDWALRPAQACKSSALLGHSPNACQVGDPHKPDPHTHDLRWLHTSGLHRPARFWPAHAPKAYRGLQNSTLPACIPQACQVMIHRHYMI